MNKDKKISMDLFNLYLDNLEVSKNLMDSLIPIVWKFDGKVYNSRFDNAIKAGLEELESEIGQRVWTVVSLDLNMFKLELNFTKRSIHTDSGCVYLPSSYDEDSVKICSKYSVYSETEENKNYHDETFKGDEYYFYIDSNYNNRIKAEAIVNAMQKHQKELEKTIFYLKEEAKKVDEYEARVNELKEKMERLHKIIPYCFSDFFDLKTYATYQ